MPKSSKSKLRSAKESAPQTAENSSLPKKQFNWISVEFLSFIIAIASFIMAIYSVVEARQANQIAQEANKLAQEANSIQLLTSKSDIAIDDYQYSMTVRPQGCLTNDTGNSYGIIHASFFNSALENKTLRDTELRGIFIKENTNLNWELYPYLGGKEQNLPITLAPDYHQTWWVIAVSQENFKTQDEALASFKETAGTRDSEVVFNFDYGAVSFPITMWYSIYGVQFNTSCELIKNDWIEYYGKKLSTDLYDR
jgi:hypothetical protein